jgi:hypothetical protein
MIVRIPTLLAAALLLVVASVPAYAHFEISASDVALKIYFHHSTFLD